MTAGEGVEAVTIRLRLQRRLVRIELMIAFDTDVVTEILLGNVAFVQRASSIPIAEQCLPVVVVEEIIRGRLNTIRQAEAGRSLGERLECL